MEHLYRNFAMVLDVLGEIDRSHSARGEPALDAVVGGDYRCKAIEYVDQCAMLRSGRQNVLLLSFQRQKKKTNGSLIHLLTDAFAAPEVQCISDSVHCEGKEA